MHATATPDVQDTDSIDINSLGAIPAETFAGITLDHTNFDLGTHDGMITIHNPATGNHRTFRVRTQPDGAKFAPGRRVVSLLTGPNREDPESWQGFGFVETDLNGAWVRVWRKFQNDGAFDTFARMLASPKTWAAKGAEYLVEARCRRCSRPLSHPESVTTGYGPHCREMV